MNTTNTVPTTRDTLGSFLAAARDRAGLYQADVARLRGVSRSAQASTEQSDNPSIATIASIATALEARAELRWTDSGSRTYTHTICDARAPMPAQWIRANYAEFADAILEHIDTSGLHRTQTQLLRFLIRAACKAAPLEQEGIQFEVDVLGDGESLALRLPRPDQAATLAGWAIRRAALVAAAAGGDTNVDVDDAAAWFLDVDQERAAWLAQQKELLASLQDCLDPAADQAVAGDSLGASIVAASGMPARVLRTEGQHQ